MSRTGAVPNVGESGNSASSPSVRRMPYIILLHSLGLNVLKHSLGLVNKPYVLHKALLSISTPKN